MLNWLLRWLGFQPPLANNSHSRSPRWPALRDRVVRQAGCCAVCGATAQLTAHHILPFHLFPERELDESNLIVLCEGPVVNCHFLFGHFRNWQSYNPAVSEDAATWSERIRRARLP